MYDSERYLVRQKSMGDTYTHTQVCLSVCSFVLATLLSMVRSCCFRTTVIFGYGLVLSRAISQPPAPLPPLHAGMHGLG